MSARSTHESGKEASKDGDQLNSKAETDIKAVATARADSDNESMNNKSGSNAKRDKVSTEKATGDFISTSTGAATSAGVEDDTRVPNDMKSISKSFAEMSGLSEVVHQIGSASDGDDGGKIGGGSVHVRSSSKTSPADDSAALIETTVNTHEAAEEIVNSSVSVGDAAVAVATYKSVISGMARANESNPITEENYYLLHWLYRIRRASCARGLLIGFLQPDFLWVIYRPMMRSKKLWRTNRDIFVAADLWCYNRTKALKRYGHISNWDVSCVTDMSTLFEGLSVLLPVEDRYRGKGDFNDDISRWDVSNVTNMSRMLTGARSFNQPLGNWDVSNVTNMSYMFSYAQSFNQPVGDWDVSKVTNTAWMFGNAHTFNQPLRDWDVSKVTDTNAIFWNAVSFNQDLTRWDLRSVTNPRNIFHMFQNTPAMQRDNKPARVR